MPKTSLTARTAGDSAAAPVETDHRSDPMENPFTSMRWGWYFLSLLIPFAGIFIALFLYDQDSREVRKVGRNCLFTSFLTWVVFPFVVVLGLFLLGIVAAAGMAADLLSAG